MSLELVWNLADLFMGLMTLLNLSALLYLCPRLLRVLAHWKQQKSSRRNDSSEAYFRKEDLLAKDQVGIDAW